MGTTGSVDGDVDDDDDEDYSTLDTSGGFFVDTIVAKGLPEGPGVPSEVGIRGCSPYHICHVHRH